MILELWGHYKTHSLSLLADAIHLLVDISGFIVSIATLKIAKKPENERMTYGYQRIEIIGAMGSIMLIWAAVAYLMIESFHKYIHPQEIDGLIFFGIAVIGFFVNLLCMYVLHYDEYKHEVSNKNLNIRATYVHVVGDVIQSVGVIIASAIIYYYPKAVIADVLCTIFFAVMVLVSTIFILKDGIHILSEGAPASINQDLIKKFILSEEAVIKITEFKLWSISASRNAISIKILVDHLLIKEYETLLIKFEKFLKEGNKIEFVTIQIDTPQTCKVGTGFVIGGLAV